MKILKDGKEYVIRMEADEFYQLHKVLRKFRQIEWTIMDYEQRYPVVSRLIKAIERFIDLFER